MAILNKDFLANPYLFITKYAVNTFGLESSVYGKASADIRAKSYATNLLAQTTSVSKSCEIVLKKISGSEAMFCIAFEDKDNLTPPYKPENLGGETLIDTPEENKIKGYFIPFKDGAVNDADADIGWVDIPKNPRTDKGEMTFAFTTGMNGCHLVVAKSPADPDMFRIYHYQSPATNTKNKYWKGKNPNASAFPHDVYYWLKATTYVGMSENQWDDMRGQGKAPSVSCFNFLEYKLETDPKTGVEIGHWWVYSQPVSFEVGNNNAANSNIKTSLSDVLVTPFSHKIQTSVKIDTMQFSPDTDKSEAVEALLVAAV